MVGESLGPYDILELLGAGGMGEVYLALDTRLRRKVAIKVLPAAFAEDPDLLARFTQEARASAALNHPNIAVVHDVGEADGTHFMVQEYLQGATLGDVLADGALPIKRALRLASEIVSALAAAHRSGIVHRDLKPANVFVVKGDHAKVLDFGLAKLIPGHQAVDPELTESPTQLGTIAGVIMGSAGYMAPEQVRGAEIDQRADIFAFGSLLYEMTSGRRAFGGGTAVEVLHGILHAEPTSMATIDATLPADLVRIVDKALAKEPDRRYQNSDDLAVDVLSLSEDVTLGKALSVGAYMRAEARERPTTTRQPPWWPAVAVTLAAVAAVAGYVGRDMMSPEVPAVAGAIIKFGIELPVEQELTQSAWTRPLALSPDGTRLIYRGGAPAQLYLRAFDEQVARPIPGTEGGDTPFFSPDGEWVGFFADMTHLRRVRLSTGEVQTICDCTHSGGGVVWRPDDTIVFVEVGAEGRIQSVAASGGAPVTLIPSALGESPPFFPIWITLLPDGETLAALGIGAELDANVVAVADGDRWRALAEPGLLGEDATGPLRYVSSGHLVYSSAGALVAVPFDAEALEFRGTPVVVVPAIEVPLSFGSPAFFDVSYSGSLVSAEPRPASALRSLVRVDQTGTATPLRATAAEYWFPRLSPDALALSVHSGAYTWLVDLERDTRTRLTARKSVLDGHPLFSSDGQEIVVGSLLPGTWESALEWERVDSSGTTRTVPLGSIHPTWGTAWTPNGSMLLTQYVVDDYDILILPVDEDGEFSPPVAFVQTPGSEGGASLSRNGEWVAYVSDESGQLEVYAQPYPGPGRRWTISTGGGTSPAWAPDGRTLYYRSGTRMMSVSVRPEGALDPGRPELVFDNPDLAGAGEDGLHRNYDVYPDGQHFVMVQSPAPWAPRLNVVVNWIEELRTRVPATR